MEGENKKYVRICNLCKKEFESRTRSEYCDKCRKYLYKKRRDKKINTLEITETKKGYVEYQMKLIKKDLKLCIELIEKHKDVLNMIQKYDETTFSSLIRDVISRIENIEDYPLDLCEYPSYSTTPKWTCRLCNNGIYYLWEDKQLYESKLGDYITFDCEEDGELVCNLLNYYDEKVKRIKEANK